MSFHYLQFPATLRLSHVYARMSFHYLVLSTSLCPKVLLPSLVLSNTSAQHKSVPQSPTISSYQQLFSSAKSVAQYPSMLMRCGLFLVCLYYTCPVSFPLAPGHKSRPRHETPCSTMHISCLMLPISSNMKISFCPAYSVHPAITPHLKNFHSNSFHLFCLECMFQNHTMIWVIYS